MIVCGSVAIIFKAQSWPEGSRSVPRDRETQRCFPEQKTVPLSGEQRLLATAAANGEARPGHLHYFGSRAIVK